MVLNIEVWEMKKGIKYKSERSVTFKYRGWELERGHK